MVIILELSHPIVWLVRHVCSDKAYFRQTKDPVMKEQRTDTIYSIPCNDCDNEYIGQTKRQFGTWLKEHQKVVFLCKKGNSALSEHACLTKPHIH